jgi:hypothetical protein
VRTGRALRGAGRTDLLVEVAKSVRQDHELVAETVRDAFAGVGVVAGTEVHVRSTSPKPLWVPVDEAGHAVTIKQRGKRYRYTATRRLALSQPGAVAARKELHGRSCVTGRAYDGVPAIARVAPGTRRLVTLTLPSPDGLALRDWPWVRVYAGRDPGRWPNLVVGDWLDDLYATAAHEAAHVRQFEEHRPHSEREAEEIAAAALTAWTPRLL